MRQQADVGHAQDRVTPVPVAVIPLHSLRPGDGAESLRQGQALRVLVCDQRLLAVSSEAHCPVSGQSGGKHQSELGAERESLRRPHGGIVRAKINESQAS